MERALHALLGPVGLALNHGARALGRVRSKLGARSADARCDEDARLASPWSRNQQSSPSSRAAMTVAAGAALGEAVSEAFAGPLFNPFVELAAGATIAAIAWRSAHRTLDDAPLARRAVATVASRLHAQRASSRAAVSLLRLATEPRRRTPALVAAWAFDSLRSAARDALLDPIPMVASPRRALTTLRSIQEAALVVACVEAEARRLGRIGRIGRIGWSPTLPTLQLYATPLRLPALVEETVAEAA